jgi:hypothetical protein
MVGCIINHNTWAFTVTNCFNGFNFVGCQLWGGKVYIYASSGIAYEAGMIAVESITFHDGAQSFVRGNKWIDTYGGTVTYVNNTMARCYGNNKLGWTLNTAGVGWMSENSMALGVQAGMTAPLAGFGLIWNSNKVLYWITDAKTNLVTDGR